MCHWRLPSDHSAELTCLVVEMLIVSWRSVELTHAFCSRPSLNNYIVYLALIAK